MNTIDLTGEEASLLIEISTDALYRRIKWSIGPRGSWHELGLPLVQTYIGALSTLHLKGWMVLRDIDSEIIPEFDKAFMIPDIVWDLTDEITSAKSWDDVPSHLHSPTLCVVCRVLSYEQANILEY